MKSKTPKHIAIIMDGNGRWAKARGLSRTLGHKEGVKRVVEMLREAKKLGIKIVTVFAFSSENWSRSGKEVNKIFSYMRIFLDLYKQELLKQGVRLNMIGRRDRIDEGSMKKLQEIEVATANNEALLFNVALDYGGRWDIVQAAKKIAKDYKTKKISTDGINEAVFSNYLSLRDLPDPDLMIRTSGEERVSNFLIWNLAYSELYFCPKHWPDFDKKELAKAIDVYSKRKRRFGKV
ncbi:MAG: isoprenyl transferase [Candidatus Omnitrophica bacterium]|nr:isoprenyl transferase [Candidatus Omnitrophota bacterium]